MKALITAGLALALTAGAATAQTMTIEFAGDDGATTNWTFDGEGNATAADGTTGSYTWDEDGKVLCGQMEEGEVCATFEEAGSAVGDSSAYTLSDGTTGTATITAVTE